jgi:hypothetical protein
MADLHTDPLDLIEAHLVVLSVAGKLRLPNLAAIPVAATQHAINI